MRHKILAMTKVKAIPISAPAVAHPKQELAPQSVAYRLWVHLPFEQQPRLESVWFSCARDRRQIRDGRCHFAVCRENVES